MTDIVERLKWRAKNTSSPSATTPMMCAEAADEIERLRAENEKLRAALHDSREGSLQLLGQVGQLSDEITRLKDGEARLRAALEEYVCDCSKYACQYFPCGELARAALEEKAD